MRAPRTALSERECCQDGGTQPHQHIRLDPVCELDPCVRTRQRQQQANEEWQRKNEAYQKQSQEIAEYSSLIDDYKNKRFAERGLTEALEVTRPVLERYQRHLFHQRKRDGEPLSFRSQHAKLVALRSWFKWLTRQNHILHNPASELELPRLPHRLPRHVLTAHEAEQVQPGRQPLKGRQAKRGGNGRSADPLEGKRIAQALKGRRRQGSKPNGRDSARSAGRSPRARRRYAGTRARSASMWS